MSPKKTKNAIFETKNTEEHMGKRFIMKTIAAAGGKRTDISIRRVGFFSVAALCISIVPALADGDGRQRQDEAAIETRLRQTVEYLASDELQGRGPRTEGIDKAAEFIAKRMGRMGLRTDALRGGPYQFFYTRLSDEADAGGVLELNPFSYFGDMIYQLFARIGESSDNEESSENRMAGDERAVKLKNVVGVLEGQGPSADETIVIGAHYDHLGERRTDDGQAIVFHGANDNASGVATMLETAGILAGREKKLPRRIVFVAFSGEELGMRGSFYYVRHPAVPLDKTVAMINLDVVGRMENETLVSMGAATSKMFAETIDEIVKRRGLKLDEMSWVYPVSDHTGFYARGIPAVFFMSGGGWGDMHTPGDTADTLNYAGMRKVSQTAADLAVAIAEAGKPPEFSEEGVPRTLYRLALRAWVEMSN